MLKDYLNDYYYYYYLSVCIYIYCMYVYIRDYEKILQVTTMTREKCITYTSLITHYFDYHYRHSVKTVNSSTFSYYLLKHLYCYSSLMNECSQFTDIVHCFLYKIQKLFSIYY